MRLTSLFPSALAARPTRSRPAFTMIELLLAVAVIALLSALVMSALAMVRGYGKAVRTTSDARGLAVGYSTLAEQENGRLPFGYTPPTVNGQVIKVRLNTGLEVGFPVSDRWPWRLAPAVSDIWSVLYAHADSPPPLPEPGDSPAVQNAKAYTLSVSPGFGLNSCYLGGHDGVWQGFIETGGTYRPNVGRHVAFHQSDVRDHARQIVFAETKVRNAAVFDDNAGFFTTTPPRARGRKWEPDGNQGFRILAPAGQLVGLPEGRHGRGTAVAFLDGHAELMQPADLADMRYWAPDARTGDYDF